MLITFICIHVHRLSHVCRGQRSIPQIHSLCPPYGSQESTEVVRCGSRCLYSLTISLACQESHSKAVVLDFNYNQVAHFLFEPNNPTVNHLFNLPGSTVNTCGHRASNFLYITKHQGQRVYSQASESYTRAGDYTKYTVALGKCFTGRQRPPCMSH